ncbi:unnamed protein product [Ilex paraguariensis]|uniref:Uncharacterized protein n=1 Tax=Ilex paraguariensis TaxID=185542 RepID=A0ABC8QW86_9AQUA
MSSWEFMYVAKHALTSIPIESLKIAEGFSDNLKREYRRKFSVIQAFKFFRQPEIDVLFGKMCPLRFILVFFSAVLAGYFAWRAVRSSTETETVVSDDTTTEKISSKDKQELKFVKMIQNGFWVFVDMASGKYLWRNLREMKNDEKMKSC